MKHALPFTLLTLALAAPGGAEEFFTDRIAPLLKQRCFECHSHESGKMKGGLTLDSKPGWAEGGEHGPAILPGAPENSLLVKMVRWTDADHQMPPKEKLPDEEIALLEEWIKRGAPDPRAALVKPPPDADWWSLRPLAAPAVPGAPDPSLTHPIDRFIRARLAGAALSPAPAADARTLIRRVTLTRYLGTRSQGRLEKS